MSVTREEATIAAFDTALNELLKLRPSVRRPVLLKALDEALRANEVSIEYRII